MQWYIKGVKGFHSNDTRMVVAENVEEIHFTPGTPFFIKAGLAYSF
ncbi:hypothetical protein [Neptunitalea chrysea]|nr:hypothetical protein [Neptunitalea chrysea]